MKGEMEMMEDVVIVGAGIAGLATAVALKRVGVRALVLERSQGIRATGAALTLFPNAWLALDALGVSHKLTRSYDPLFKGSVTNINTGDVQQVLFSEQGIRPVHRKALLEALAEELPTTQFDSRTGRWCSIAVVHLEDGTAIKSKVLIGCDGVHSVVARWLGLAEPVHSGRSAVRSLAVFPQGHRFKHEVQQFVDQRAKGLLSRSKYKEKYLKIRREFSLDIPGRGQTCRSFDNTWAPLMFRHPWRIIFGNLNKGNITVAGDAMHPMTPELGQGGGSSLEDAVVLGRHIGNSIIKNGGQFVEGDMAKAIDDYVKERRWRAALLVTGSYLSGWIQLGGAKWWEKFLRDRLFFKYIFGWLGGLAQYNCGNLPAASSSERDGGRGDRRSRHCRVGNSSGSEKSRGSSFGSREIARDTNHRCSLDPVSNAWLALDALGVSHKLTRSYDPLVKGSVTNINTGDVQQVLFPEQAIRTVHRKALLEALAEELPTDSIRFSSKLAAIEIQEQGGGASIAVVHLEDGTAIKSKVLIGCDGVHSVVARWLGLAEPVHSGRSAVRSLAVFPQGHRFKHEIQMFVDQQGKRAAFIPLNDREFYWFLTCKANSNCGGKYDRRAGANTKRSTSKVRRVSLDIPGRGQTCRSFDNNMGTVDV
uniref:FAD-binding domain-containing protein n=1 Tax=Salix viminalis TaxID=40686 RepID=A0A6N2MRE8_SALVM